MTRSLFCLRHSSFIRHLSCMGNESGHNGHYNGTRPPDAVLGPALREYSRKSLPLNQRLEYLFKDFDYKIGLTTLKKLNRKFDVPTVKKPPPAHIASTLVAAVTMNNISSRNGPCTVQTQISLQDGVKIPRDTVRQIMSDIDPDGAETRFPGRRRLPKQRGHLTDTAVYYELHFDGHEKLNFKALRMGPVGIDIYGARFAKDGVFFQATVDGGSETGEMYAAHLALRQHCMPEISLEDAPAFVVLKSTDNIPIESSWHLFTNYVGLDIKQVLLLGKSHNYFIPGIQLHVDLFNCLWPKIVQLSLDNFVEYWNNHKIRNQRNKLLPSGFSPNYVSDFPEKFGLTYFGVPAPQHLVDALRENIPKSREECYRWVTDEFEAKAWEVYHGIGAPPFALTDGMCRARVTAETGGTPTRLLFDTIGPSVGTCRHSVQGVEMNTWSVFRDGGNTMTLEAEIILGITDTRCPDLENVESNLDHPAYRTTSPPNPVKIWS
ncbi:hypothetical protein B0H10DRAFT_2199975 [Mycena sp. CBHHK59/15]|nr:hypothetical protein B0H10DRAFT_2199975 [Mycena sp. CBHHK59/15]